MIALKELLDNKGEVVAYKLDTPNHLTSSRAFLKQLESHKQCLLSHEILDFALRTIVTGLKRMVLEEGLSVSIDDLGSFRPRVSKTKKGKNISILFRPGRDVFVPCAGNNFVINEYFLPYIGGSGKDPVHYSTRIGKIKDIKKL